MNKKVKSAAKSTKKKQQNNIWLFVMPSLLGVFLFLVPFPLNGMTTVMFGHINAFVKDGTIGGAEIYNMILWFGAGVVTISALLTIWSKVKPSCPLFKTKLGQIFETTSMGALVRIIGALLYVQIMVGPITGIAPLPVGHMFAWLTDDYTGAIIVGDFIGSLIVTFTIGTLILPLLLEFGLLEFIGSSASKVTEKLFLVPGRAAVDAAASFVGDGTLGIVVTDEQYAQGHYTKRQAVTIATGFSVVGIAFTTFVAGELGFLSGADFFKFYGTIIFVTIILAIIIPRTPIMKMYPDTTIDGKAPTLSKLSKQVANLTPTELACQKAEHGMANVKEIYTKALLSVATIIMTWIPIIIFVGSFALAFAEGYVYNIDLFGIISTPLVPLIKLLQIPDAVLVAEGIMVSIADMYIPTLIIAESTSELAKFVVGTMSFISIIFFAETGVVLMKSKMKLSWWEVVMFFVIRVIIALPFVAIIGHIIV